MLKGKLQEGRGHPIHGAGSGGKMENGMKSLCQVSQ